MAFQRGQNSTNPALTDMQKRYEAETGSTMFSKSSNSSGAMTRRNRLGRGKDKKAFEEWSKTTGGMDAGKDRFNAMMANRSQNPVLGQTQAGMSGFDKFQAMQAGRNVPTLGQPSSVTASGMPGMLEAVGDIMKDEQRNAAQDGKLNQAGYDRFQAMQAARDSARSTYGQKIGMELISDQLAAKGDPRSIFSDAVENYRNRNSGQPAGYDKFQAMQAARDSANYNVDGSSLPPGVVSWADLENGSLQNKIRAHNAGQRSEQAAKFNAAMGANPLILQQLQMGQRQMGPQFNAFGFGAQPGLAAQGGQGGSMLANMSSQGMNQLAAGQQNNPTIFKAKS